MISLGSLVGVAIYLVVAGLVVWLLLWLIDYIAPPDPFNKIARVVIVVLGVLVIIGALLSLVGVGVGPVFRA